MDRVLRLDRARPPDRTLPRYASYPTASWFREDVGAAQADAWIAALPQGATIALHVHIPFCERLCWFCCCRTQGMTSLGPVADYVAALRAEIDRVGSILPADVRVDSIRWLGGSPTILPPELIRALDGHLRSALPVATDAAFAVEIEPHGVDPAKLDALLERGLTEVALGLQDFDPQVQAAIGRAQRPEWLEGAFGDLRGRGVRTVTAELLYGLPRQSAGSIARTAERLAALGPDRVVLAGYAHVPWMAKRQRMIDETNLPDGEARAAQFVAASEVLRAARYVACGMDHFAMLGDPLAQAAAAGRMRRDLSGYVARGTDAVIGLGAASISRLPQGYVQNVAETRGYRDRVSAGAGAGVRGVALRLEDRVRGRAIEMLLCDLVLDLERLRAEFGDFSRVVDAACAAALERFGGAVERTARGLALRADGPLLARRVARLFDAHAGAPEGRAC